MFFKNFSGCFHVATIKIALNVIALPLSPIICQSSNRLLYVCELLYFFLSMKIWLLLKGHMWQSLTLGIEFVSCLWLWDCSLSPMQPWRGRGHLSPCWVTFYSTWSYQPPWTWPCSIGFISASWPSGLWFLSSLYIFSFAQNGTKSKSPRNILEFLRKGFSKIASLFDNDTCILCLIPLFVVLCSEKMERSLEMTEKAV